MFEWNEHPQEWNLCLAPRNIVSNEIYHLTIHKHYTFMCKYVGIWNENG